MRALLLFLACLCQLASTAAVGAPVYAWTYAAGGETLAQRVAPPPGFIRTHATQQNSFAHLRWKARSIVVDRDLDRAPGAPRLDGHARPAPLACVIEQVADHLVEIFPLNADGQILRHAHVDRQTAFRIQAPQRARKPFC